MYNFKIFFDIIYIQVARHQQLNAQSMQICTSTQECISLALHAIFKIIAQPFIQSLSQQRTILLV